jgi:hypothetical protein
LLKQSFAQMVISERGDKLRITPEELVEGRLYAGMEAVRMGLVDEVGDDTDAIAKAASLAGISNYELVDVNVEVDRIFVLKVRRVFESLEDGEDGLSLTDLLALSDSAGGVKGADNAVEGSDADSPMVNLGRLRRFMLSGTLAESQKDSLPGLPIEINKPNIYYIYAGQSP